MTLDTEVVDAVVEPPAGRNDGDEAATDGEGAPDRTPRRILAAEIGYGFLAAGLSLLAGIFGLQFWQSSLGVPIVYSGDTVAGLAMLQALRETGWWFTNDRLGAPFGLEHLDFPSGGESLQMAMARVLTFFTSQEAVVLNVYFLLTFALVGGAAYAALRLIHIDRAVAVVIAVLYSVLPFHFWHGAPHLWRSGYFAAPLAGVALLWLLGYDGGIATRTGQRWWTGLRWRRRRVAFVAGAAVLAGLTDTVAASFPAVLAGAVAVALLVTRRSAALAGAALGFGVLCVGTVVIANIPTLVYEANNGPNPEVLQREPSEQLIYALTPARLLTPIPDHRIGPLADFGQDAIDESGLTSEGGQQLGLVGALGLVGGIAVLLGRAASARIGPEDRRRSLVAACGALALVSIAVASAIGFAFLASLSGLEEIRTWNRIVVYIAFFSLVVSAVALGAMRPALQRRSRWLWLAVLGVVGVAGVLDQTPSTATDYDRIASSWDRDKAFFGEVENVLDDGSQVFDLPVAAYPEPTSDTLVGYSHMRGVLHTEDTEFSYGAMRGRDGRWLTEVGRLPLSVALDGLSVAGFEAVHVDLWGYPSGDPGIDTELGYGPVLENERDVLWLLDDRRQQVESRLGAVAPALADEVLYPVAITPGDGTFPAGDAATSRLAESEATLHLTPMGGGSRTVRLLMTVNTAEGPYTLTVDAGARTEEFLVLDGVAFVDMTLDVPGEGMDVVLSTDAPSFQAASDAREVHMAISDLSAFGPVVTELVERLDDEQASRRVVPG